MLKVAQWVGADSQRLSIAESLQATARSLRTTFIDYIGKLGVEQESLAWWLGSLSGKNPAVSKAFLHICYVSVAVQLCYQRAGAGTLMFVVESRGVSRAIAGCLRERGIRFIEHEESLIHRVIETSRDLAEMVARRVLGLVRMTGKMMLARLAGLQVCAGAGTVSASSQPVVLLYNWVDARSFSADGRYRDVYFGPLRDHLERRGIRVAVVATILPGTSYWGVLREIKRAGVPVLVPHASLTVSILVRYSVALMKPTLSRRTCPRLCGFDISQILVEEIRKDRIKNRLWEVGLISSVVRRWCERVRVGTFIYPYEGHTWERAYCQAFREHSPETKLVGYQHATVSPMWLNHFVSHAELGRVPFPDRIVTNGPHHHELFVRNGLPAAMLVPGAAFRYEALCEEKPRARAARLAQSDPYILLAPSIIATSAAELLLAVLEAFPNGEGFKVVLRCHPCLPLQHAMVEAGLRDLPSHVEVDQGPLAALLERACVLVYSDSTIALEALASGVPVVHYSSGFEIDLDPLEGFDDLRVSTGTVEGLRDAVRLAAKTDPQARAALLRRAREVVSRMLAEPAAAAVDLFVLDDRCKAPVHIQLSSEC